MGSGGRCSGGDGDVGGQAGGALEATAKASIAVGDPNDVIAVKLDKVMADTNTSIEY